MADPVVDPAAPAAPAATPAEGSAPAAQAPATADVKPADDAAKPADQTTDPAKADPDAKPADTAKPAAPEKYEFVAPEGTTLDPAVTTKFSEVARKFDLSQEKAQELVNEMAPTIVKQNAEAINAMVEKAGDEWLALSKNDPVLAAGNFDENMVTARRALDAYGTPELKALLDSSKLGNHPEVVRWMFKVGQTVAPDTKHITGAQPGAGAETTLESRLWPSK